MERSISTIRLYTVHSETRKEDCVYIIYTYAKNTRLFERSLLYRMGAELLITSETELGFSFMQPPRLDWRFLSFKIHYTF